ncbi:MAG TPA: OmpA family protein [Polyangiales bacterium]|nr:OmpA family protein [Polyangiales bacterium]
MAHASTGPGQIKTDPRVPAGGVRAVLMNFDVDSAELKPQHREFLDRSVAPVLVHKRARIWLQGQASNTGSQRHNLELSHRRAQQVAAHLASRGVQATQMQIDWVGESLAGTRLQELSKERAVSLMAAPLAHVPVPAASPPATLTTPTTDTFKIRLLGALAASAGVATLERLFFQIWDPSHALTCFYMYQSGGLAKGKGPILSATLSGPWNKFTTTKPIAVDEFAGAARFSTAGTMWWTVNYLNIMGLPAGVATAPNPLELETGFTMGLGIGSTLGEMVKGYMGPFTGH